MSERRRGILRSSAQRLGLLIVLPDPDVRWYVRRSTTNLYNAHTMKMERKRTSKINANVMIMTKIHTYRDSLYYKEENDDQDDTGS